MTDHDSSVLNAEPGVPPAPSVAKLIARLEAAHIADRALDEAIATEIWGEPHPSGNVGGPRTLIWWDRSLGRAVAPEFTASVDAALSLLPDWVFVRLERYSDGWYATIRPHSDAADNEKRGVQKPAALAVCIAAMHVRASVPQPERVSDRNAPNTDAAQVTPSVTPIAGGGR